MNHIVQKVAQRHPEIIFEPGDEFCWSYENRTVIYPKAAEPNEVFTASLCHEVGHALSGHSRFLSDVELLKLEREAWVRGSEVAQESFAFTVPEQHIERCLDTYRDWLYERAVCPTCKQCGMQSKSTEYSCVFCNTTWRVNQSRLCRVTKRRLKTQ